MDIEAIQKNTLEILEYIDRVCKENNLKYFLSGGTLLGAVRHKGFIPWDDDIDIMMLREDYNRLIQLEKKEFTQRYRMSELSLDNSWPEPWMQIWDSTTILYWPHKKKKKIGIYVDVIPIDYLPADNKKTEKIFKKLKKYNVFRNSALRKGFIANEKFRILKKALGMWTKLMGAHYYAEKMENLMKNAAESTSGFMGAGVVCHYGSREKMPSSVFDNAVMVMFENGEYPAPVGYKSYLSKLYGNYMQLPPEEKRVSEHTYVIEKWNGGD